MRGRVTAAAGLLLMLAACTSESTSTTTGPGESTTATEEGTTSTVPMTTTSTPGAPIVREEVMITEDQSYPEGVVIPADESWVLDPNTSITLSASGNVEVLGELVMQPGSGDVEHTLRFEGVDESAFVGGGMDP
ncbi:MAG TPA: hypothetical protein VIC07_11440, partial [Acidimicrobiia bacterium]